MGIPRRNRNRHQGKAGKVSKCRLVVAACTKAHALAVITEGDVFQTQDFETIYTKMESQLVFDGRKILDYNQLQSIGFTAYKLAKQSGL